ncbi:MAG TPA: PAS domain S-box protein [Sideroxyarcus sp.]|nr:PAS domain S-box protein [Sideroxyarcus sp.]
MRLRHIGLPARITILVLLLVAAGGMLWVGEESRRLHEAYLDERSADLEVALHVERARLNQSIDVLRQDVLFLANTPPVSGIVRAAANRGIDPRDQNSYERWEKRLQEIFAAFLRAHPEYYQVRYIGVADNGRELVRVESRDGRIDVMPREALQTKGERDYFKAGLELTAGRVHLSEFNLNQEWGRIEEPRRPSLRAVTPVFDAGGNVFGMLVLHKAVGSLFASAMVGLPPGVEGYIADQQGHYLLHPDEGRAFAFEFGGKDNIADDFPSLKPMFGTQSQNYLPLHAVGSGGDYIAAERVFFDASQPSRFLLLAYRLPAAVVATQSGDAPLPNIANTLLVMALISVVFMLILRHIFAPLKRITGAAHDIAAGNRHIRLAEKRGGEIGELAEAMNVMLDRLSSGEQVARENDFRKELIESLPGVFYMIDLRGQFLMWNRNLEQVLQLDREAIAMKHPLDLFEGDDKARIEAAIHKVFEQGEVSVEAVLVAKDGKKMPYHFTGRRVEHQGEPVLVGMGLDIGEQRESMRVTRMLLRRNRALMDNSMEGIHILDLDGNVLEANEGFCRMLGYTREEIEHLNVADWDKQFTLDELKARIKAFIGKSDTFETVHCRKDGTLLNVEICATGVEIEGNSYLFATSRDITERKRTELALRRNKQVLDTAMDGFWLTDLQGNIEAANEAYAQLSGYTVQELAGMHISQLEALERPEDTRSHIEKIMTEGRDRFETKHRRKDGAVIDIEVSVTLMPEDGKLFVFCRDITERKKVEQVLRRNKQVLETAMDGYWMTDAEGYLEEVNEAYAKMSGYSVQELVGMHIGQLEAGENEEEVRAHIDRIVARGYDRFETRHRRKDGRVIDVEVTTTYMPEEQRFFVFSHNITQRKHAEQELRVAAATFETHDAILITDAESNIIRVNRAFTEITGYSAAEVLGKNPRIMSSGRHDRDFYLKLWQQLLSAGSWSGEIWDRRKNGEVYPKWMTISAVKDERHETVQYVAIFSDITERKRIEEEIRSLAFYDPLTQLPNRRLFIERLRAALSASVRRRDYGAVLFLDMDNFKSLNDTLGHDFGDLMLIEVANRIKSCVREMDTVARLGGDEFVVLIEGVSHDEQDALRKVATVAEKIRESLARPYKLKEHEHHSSPSIGITLYHDSEKSVDTLLKHADLAMYQAKNSGRNAVRFFDPVMQDNAERHDELEEDLHHALERGELRLYYQVQVDAEQRPVGAEALLRWQHPQRGLVSPDQFIHVAEESALILEIGRWVLHEACAQLARWQASELMRQLTLTVNISMRQFAQPDFVGQVAAAVGQFAIEPARLKLELTETVVSHDLSGAVEKMKALRSLGIALSMNDFGTVYSSLYYLKHLSSDQLKIHREVVQGVAAGGGDAQLVQAIVDLAKNMDLRIFAEGVETEAQFDFLKRHDCQGYQGYLFSKPVPLEELEVLLREAQQGRVGC